MPQKQFLKEINFKLKKLTLFSLKSHVKRAYISKFVSNRPKTTKSISQPIQKSKPNAPPRPRPNLTRTTLKNALQQWNIVGINSQLKEQNDQNKWEKRISDILKRERARTAINFVFSGSQLRRPTQRISAIKSPRL